MVFDQRGSGRSTPHAADPDTDLSTNTTWHLLGDIELLREQLGIDRWLVLGSSWGATLAIMYGEQLPERVSEIVLGAVTNTRRLELDWMYRGGVAPLLPAQWERFRQGVPRTARNSDLLEAYYRLLNGPDLDVRRRAADDWCRWELSYISSDPEEEPFTGRFADPRYRMGFARLVTHYFRHGAWIRDGSLLANAYRLAQIPGVMVHGRLDIGSPLLTAWEMKRAWPRADLVVVPDAGHGGDAMSREVVRATDRFRGRAEAA